MMKIQRIMYGYYYYCAGCHRRCRGSNNPCLDCVQALDALSRAGYLQGYHEGMEWGMGQPPSLKIQSLPSSRSPTVPYRATKYLSKFEEEKAFVHAYERGFRRGMRAVESVHQIYQAVLEELLVDVGRRQAMLYCAKTVSDWLQRFPEKRQLMDFNLLKEIDRYF